MIIRYPFSTLISFSTLKSNYPRAAISSTGHLFLIECCEYKLSGALLSGSSCFEKSTNSVEKRRRRRSCPELEILGRKGEIPRINPSRHFPFLLNISHLKRQLPINILASLSLSLSHSLSFSPFTFTSLAHSIFLYGSHHLSFSFSYFCCLSLFLSGLIASLELER